MQACASTWTSGACLAAGPGGAYPTAGSEGAPSSIESTLPNQVAGRLAGGWGVRGTIPKGERWWASESSRLGDTEQAPVPGMRLSHWYPQRKWQATAMQRRRLPSRSAGSGSFPMLTVTAGNAGLSAPCRGRGISHAPHQLLKGEPTAVLTHRRERLPRGWRRSELGAGRRVQGLTLRAAALQHDDAMAKAHQLHSMLRTAPSPESPINPCPQKGEPDAVGFDTQGRSCSGSSLLVWCTSTCSNIRHANQSSARY